MIHKSGADGADCTDVYLIIYASVTPRNPRLSCEGRLHYISSSLFSRSKSLASSRGEGTVQVLMQSPGWQV